MKIINNVLVILSVLLIGNLYSQQAPQFTNYIYNTMSVNPAYAGVQGRGVLNFSSRSPWVGLNGSGSTRTISYNSPLKKFNNLGLGGNLMRDAIGPVKEISLDFNSSYKIEVRTDHYLALGLKLGVNTFSFDTDKIDAADPDDPEINEYNNSLSPAIGAGMYYYAQKFYFGASMPILLQNYDFRNKRYLFYFIGGYVFDLKPDLKFKPAFLAKTLTGSTPSLDVSANFLLKEKINLGLSYRIFDSVSALFGLQLSERLQVGYSYDLTTSKLRSAQRGTHEIFIRYTYSKIIIDRRLKCYF